MLPGAAAEALLCSVPASRLARQPPWSMQTAVFSEIPRLARDRSPMQERARAPQCRACQAARS